MVTVNVVIPVFNGEDTIQRAIRSALAQKGIAVQVTVVDHGSSDHTVSKVLPFVRPGRVTLIRLDRLSNEKRNAARPLERGVREALASAKDLCDLWFLRLDADDVLADDDCVLNLVARSRGLQLVIGRLIFFDEHHRSSETYAVAAKYRTKQCLLRGAAYSVPHHASLIRVDLIRRVIEGRGFAFDSSLGYGEDLDFTLELVRACERDEIGFVDFDVCYKRLDGLTVSRSTSLFSIACDHTRIFRRHHLLWCELCARAAADLALRFVGLEDSWLRSRLGYPGKRWAAINAVGGDAVWRRLASLDRSTSVGDGT